MSSVNIATPSPKLILNAVGIVVVLHIVTAIALAMTKTTMPIIEPPEMTPPIEIEMVTPPVEVEEPEVVEEIEIKPELAQTQPQIQPKTKLQNKPKPLVQKSVKKQPDRIKKNTAIITPEESSKTPLKDNSNSEKQGSESSNDVPNTSLTEGGVKVNTTTTVIRTTKDTQALVTVSAGAGNSNNNNASSSNVVKKLDNGSGSSKGGNSGNSDNSDNTPVVTSPDPVVNVGPVNREVTNGDWLTKPDFQPSSALVRELKPGTNYHVVLLYNVDKSGRVTSVTLRQRSGDRKLDRWVQREAEKAVFRPFTKNDTSVSGVITVPLDFKIN